MVKHINQNGTLGKICAHCHTWLPLDQYGSDQGQEDGLRWQCKACTNLLIRKRTIKRRVRLIMLLGGQCHDCGDDRIWTLEFHHRDPAKKSFSLNARAMSHHTRQELVHEITKCDLLCPGCHYERHTTTGHKELYLESRAELKSQPYLF